LGRPAKKRCRAESKATRLGQLQAEYEFKKAHSIAKKPEDFLEEQVKKTLDKLEPVDLVDLAAMLGMTYIVHGIIASSTELMEKVKVLQHPEFLLLGGFGILAAQYLPLPEGTLKKVADATPDWFIWLESFTIAYIIVKHGGQLIGLLEKGLGTVVPMLLGVIAA
jgi:hypothetical protein